MNMLSISCFLIFNQTTTVIPDLAVGDIISCFLIFNQTTTNSNSTRIISIISCFLIFNQTTTNPIDKSVILSISCFLIFNQTTTNHRQKRQRERISPISEKFHVISNGHRESSSMIRLENNQLDQYPGIRIFFDYLEVENANEVRYTFEYGLLGLMVMTDYQLIEN